RLGIERSLPVNCENVHIPAPKQPFDIGLRRHCLKHAHLSCFQMAAHKQFLCLSFDGGNFHSCPVNVRAFLYWCVGTHEIAIEHHLQGSSEVRLTRTSGVVSEKADVGGVVLQSVQDDL